MISMENSYKRTGLEIAIIGMSARFPGANNLQEYWENLKNGVESISFFSEEELRKSGIDEETIQSSNYIKAHGFLDKRDFFDASFFGYTPQEAELMNPQIRIFHECVWEALEDGGYYPGAQNGRIGLYAGASSGFIWEATSHLTGKSREYGGFASTLFIDKDFLCSRVSYNLNLNGGTSFVQTACSTSLVAIHQASRALLTGESEMILAGGVSITSSTPQGYFYREGMITSPDGHCRAFAYNGNGTISGNGAGVVLLKRLKSALQDGDYIYAIIKGSAINNDGNRKVGFTAPSVDAQAEVIRTAHRMARVEPSTITYIEAHGTGTNLGDPVEFEALKLAFNSTERNYCSLGSVKSNFGHLDAAAGVAGFIKTVLSLEHKLIPPTLHSESPNPALDIENSPFYINSVPTQWQNNGNPLRAGVSSFGIGGTNVHLILEEIIESEMHPRENTNRTSPLLFLLSAKSESALEQMTVNLGAYIKDNPRINLEDVAYTLQVGRKPFQHRRIIVCQEEQTSRQLAETLLNPTTSAINSFSLPLKQEKRFIFMFPGQGAQYVNMGIELYQKDTFFRQEMDKCFTLLKRYLSAIDIDLKSILYPDSPQNSEADNLINRTDITQPVIFIFQYVLSRLLMKWGIKPEAMIGHSIGEYTAACLSGVFTLEEALQIVALRGHLMQQMPSGSMLSVPLNEEKLMPMLDKGLSFAASNSTSSSVVSGPTEAIIQFSKQLEAKGNQSRILHTSHAFHSSMMEPVLEPFTKKFTEIKVKTPQIPYISNVTGSWVTTELLTDTSYWARQLRSTVRFKEGLEVLFKKENNVFIEIGPGNTLNSFIKQHSDRKTSHFALNLTKHPKETIPDRMHLLGKIGQLWLYGAEVDWKELNDSRKMYRLPLPTYPFEGKQYKFGFEALQSGNTLGAINNRFQLFGLNKKSDITDWFYTPLWKQSPLFPQAPQNNNPLVWLIFIDRHGIGEQLKQEILQNGDRPIVVREGQEFKRLGATEYTIHPGRPFDYITLLQTLGRERQMPDRVVHLWGVTGTADKPNDYSGITSEEEVYSGYYSLLWFAQSLGREPLTSEISIAVLTDNLHEVTGQEERLQPQKSLVLGAIKVIPQEYNDIRCFGIDILLPDRESYQLEPIVQSVLNEFNTNSEDQVIALRNGYRWVQEYSPAPLTGKTTELKEKGVYLITGGLGGIGFVLAEYLAKQYKARLILTGRSISAIGEENTAEPENTNEKQQLVRKLEEYGAEVTVHQADTANLDHMKDVIHRALSRYGRLDGVIHAAGIADYKGIIQNRKKEEDLNVLLPKVRGAMVLETLLKETEVDFVVLCSSVSSLLAPAGQVGYAASNTFLDSFALYKNKESSSSHGPKRRKCANWYSINWDAWQKVGMGVDAIKRQGKNPDTALANGILPAEGIEAFQRILSSPRGMQVVVSTTDLTTRLNQWVNNTYPKESEEELEKLSDNANPRPGLTTPYVNPQNETEESLTRIWENFFGIHPLGVLDDFFELGGDSLKAMTLLSRIHKALKVNIPVGEFFNHPTIQKLAQYLKTLTKDNYFTIEAVEKKEYYPLSPTQKRLYILQQMESTSTAYNMTELIPLGNLTGNGQQKKNQLERVFIGLMKRHESFRTSFHMINNEPVQRIHDEVEFRIEEYSESREEKIGTEQGQTHSLILNSGTMRFSFDLSQCPLLRVVLVRKGNKAAYLFVTMHHIISDGVSRQLLLDEVNALMRDEDLPPLRIHYKDFAEWQKKEQQTSAVRNQETYWLKVFSGEIPVLQLPLDYSRPAVQSFSGNTLAFSIPSTWMKGLKEVAVEANVTFYMVLLSSFTVLLGKLSGQEDIVVGTPVAGRRHADLEKIIGMFVNTLALRNIPHREHTFLTYLEAVKENTLKAFDNQEYPFEELVEKVGITRDASRNPLFDTVFLLETDLGVKEAKNITGQENKIQNEEVRDIGKDGNIQSNEPHLNEASLLEESRTAKFDLTLTAVETGEHVYFKLNYCSRLFKQETAKRFIDYYKRILFALQKDSQIRLSTIDLLSQEEREKILITFNSTRTLYSRDQSIDNLFWKQSNATPDKIALVGPESLENSVPLRYNAVSYREMQQRSLQLALSLQCKGVKAETPVGIMGLSLPETIIGVLAILSAGGAYLPIDPDYPQERKELMLKDSGANLVLTVGKKGILNNTANTIEFCDIAGLETVGKFKSASTNPLTYPLEPNKQISSPQSLAYIIYTSGSTGRPKGVMVKHRNVVRLVNDSEFVSLKAGERIMQTGALEFDASTFEIWGALLNGLELYLTPKEIRLSPDTLKKVLNRWGITTIWMTSPLFNQMVDADVEIFGKLSNLLVGGDTLSPGHINKASRKYPGLKIINGYGPTENTTFSTTYSVKNDFFQKENSGSIPIGKPISNSLAVIVDASFLPVPIKIAGELLVGGDGISRGYLNAPELTAEKFIFGGSFRENRPLTPRKSVLLKNIPTCNTPLDQSVYYRTGDLTRWLEDGNIEFLGRIDHQVKIRGFRIEPGEIEHQILNLPYIKDAVVIVKHLSDKEKVLIAYFVSDSDSKINSKPLETTLKNQLASLLPDYMIPAHFIEMEQIPLTANGKINRNLLPAPQIRKEQDYVAPGDPVETQLAGLWSEILGIKSELISVNRSFFDLGGQSLKATALVSKIHREFNVKIPLADVFRLPTIKELSQSIKSSLKEEFVSIEPVEKKEYYPLSSAQKRLYVLQKLDVTNSAYNIPEVIALSGTANIEKIEKIFINLINRHESLRTSFHMLAGQPVQKIHSTVEFNIETHQTETSSPHLLRQRFNIAFDISNPPLLRVGIEKSGDGTILLIVIMHHIISDGTSRSILINDFMAMQQEEKLLPLRIQYKEFSQWQRGELNKGRLKFQEKYWERKFKGVSPETNLPVDFPRPAFQQFEGDTLRFDLSNSEALLLKQNALENGVTVFIYLFAVSAIWLSKITNQEDIVLGTPIAGRRHTDLEKLIGMFVNTLVLRSIPGGEKYFNHYLIEAKAQILEDFENQEYPFEELVEKVVFNRDTSRNPLFDVMFLLESEVKETHTEPPTEKYPQNLNQESSTTTPRYDFQSAKFDLTLSVYENGDNLSIGLNYCTKLFKRETIERFVVYYRRVLSTILNDPAIQLPRIEILDEKQKQTILNEFNNTEASYPHLDTLVSLFSKQVEQTPDNIAIKNSDETWMSYGKLKERTSQISALLTEMGVRRDRVVGVMTERSPEMIPLFMGILQSGGVYMPIAPAYPPERIGYMMTDSAVNLVIVSPEARLTAEETCNRHPALQVKLIDAKTGFSNTIKNQFIEKNSPETARPCDLAYVIYTSGSTGNPKGVMIEHKAIVNRLNWMQRSYPLQETDVILQKTPITFDVSVWELFWWSFTGASVCLLEQGGEKDPAVIIETITKKKVTTMHFVPSMLAAFLEYLESSERIGDIKSLKRVFASGEALGINLVKKFQQLLYYTNKTNLINLYGPTEAAVDVSYFNCPLNEEIEKIPIGKPIDNICLLILNQEKQMQPVGIAGELTIGGTGLARGYLNRPELTYDKFIRYPLNTSSNEQETPVFASTYFNKSASLNKSLLYCTGDLVRWSPDGNIEFLGRIDHQVKIRGFRIELGEIENRLCQHPKIKEAVVLITENGKGKQSIHAYIVSDTEFETPELRKYLSAFLPEYMIPVGFIKIPQIPLNHNGKVDRHALYRIDRSQVSSANSSALPETQIEKIVANAWKEILQVENVGIYDNFFDIGGTSLDFIRLNTRLIEILQKEIPLVEMYRHTTIHAFSSYINPELAEEDNSTFETDLDTKVIKSRALRKVQRNRRKINN